MNGPGEVEAARFKAPQRPVGQLVGYVFDEEVGDSFLSHEDSPGEPVVNQMSELAMGAVGRIAAQECNECVPLYEPTAAGSAVIATREEETILRFLASAGVPPSS